MALFVVEKNHKYMSKKTFYIILIALASIFVIGGLVWYFFFRPSTPATTPQGAGFTLPGQETAAGVLMPIGKSPVIAARFSGGDILFYDFSGQLWRMGSGDPKPAQVNQPIVENLTDIIWSAIGKNIIKAGAGQSDIGYIFSDPVNGALVNLKTGIKSVAFSPDAKKIIYQVSDSKSNSLFISDPDGKNQKTLIKDFKLRDVILNWPKTGQIAMASLSSGLVPGNLWTLDVGTLKFSKLLDNLLGLEAIFSPDGGAFIYSFVDQNGQNPILAVNKNGVSKNIENISTLAGKCAWVGELINIYCAVPNAWPDSAVLPDDYYKNAFTTMDNIWEINIETGEKNLVFQNMGDVSNIELSPDGNILIFKSRSSGLLYKLTIK